MSKKLRAEFVPDQIISQSRYGLICDSHIVFVAQKLGDVIAFQRGFGKGIICTIVNDDRD